VSAGILVPIELGDIGVEDLAVMKFHHSAEADFQGAIIDSLPPDRQAWD
jgi:hypothetical protein